MINKALSLIATRGMSTYGAVAKHRFKTLQDDVLRVKIYKLPQPHLHAMYRKHYKVMDIFNKVCFGSNSLCNIIGTKMWWKTLFWGLIGACDTNAYLAYVKVVQCMGRREACQ